MPADHPHSRSACVEAAAFTGTVVDTELNETTRRERVECPDCEREYEYVYECEGVFDTQREEYLPAAHFLVREGAKALDQFVPAEEGYIDGGGNFCLPAVVAERYERVYVLNKLVDPDTGEVFDSF